MWGKLNTVAQFFCGWLFAYVARPDDTSVETRRKREAVAISVLGIVVGGTVTGVVSVGASMYDFIAMGSMCLAFGVLFAYVVLTKSAPLCIFEFAICMLTSGLVLSTYVTTREGSPARWPFVVLFLDFCLVQHLPSRTTTAVLVIIFSGLTVIQIMDSLDITLPEPEEIVHLCDCESPPCRLHRVKSVMFLFQDFIIILADFYMTRRFAEQAREEKVAMHSTIDTVQDIAQRLSRYDVESVADILERQQGSMPSGMLTALRTLEANLRVYRPYLPDALFAHTPQESAALSVQPPGLETREAVIVFTDIRASTNLWEAAPEAMKKSLHTHNAVIRSAMSLYKGYEVKTVGDSFMVAFEGALAAIGFSLRVHEDLLDAAWPAALLRVPMCSDKGIWRGLTVRVGLHAGKVTPEHHVVTRRVDYLGHTVNVAARLEGMCTPGAVAMQAGVWDDFHPLLCGSAVADPPISVTLKGVRGAVLVRCIWPASLALRATTPLNVPRSVHGSSCSLLSSSYGVAAMSQTHATVGVVQICTEGTTDTGKRLNSALSSLTLMMTCSGGTLITMLGNSVAVGWNVVRHLGSHAESSLRFVRGIRVGSHFCVGLASGIVEHGDVGSANQRFVTAVGEPVRASWTLSDVALQNSRTCLFVWFPVTASPPVDTAVDTSPLPTSLRNDLTDSTLVVPGLNTSRVYEFSDASDSVGSLTP